MFGFPDARCGMLLLWRRSPSPSEGDRGRQANALAQFWAQKLAENRHILDRIEAGTFTLGGRYVLDAETLGEVRQWAARRVAECEARLAARDTYHSSRYRPAQRGAGGALLIIEVMSTNARLFEIVHNASKRGKALLHTRMALLEDIDGTCR